MSMLHKVLVFLVALTLADRVCAQVPSSLLLMSDTTWRSKNMMAFVGGDAGIASNAVDVFFLEKSILGGHIHREYVDALLEDMPNRSRAGYSANAQLELLNFRDTLLGRPNLGFKAAFSTNYHGYASFQPTAFETVFTGNSGARAQTQELGPLNAQSQSWQKVGFGLFNKNTLSGLTLSLVEGQSYRNLQAESALLYTSAMADTLRLDVVGSYNRSDTTRKGWANGSGVGACIDFDYNVLLDNGKRIVSFSARNLGFVVWNQASEAYTINSSTDWLGLDVSNWLNGNTDSLSMPEWSDSLKVSRNQSSMLKPLPATFHMRYLHKWKENRYWETGFVYTPNQAAVPMVYLGLTHHLGRNLWLSERVHYGGYGAFSVGAEVQWMSAKSWFIRAGTSQLDGWLLSVAGGRNAYLNLGKNF
jgi:hypothetical protein